eukprot:TRINITY_DN4299_c0_g1_i1.p1 TRINITY_DN4299_c0_g1~~TRINITY_DN4299_c0_g1_i1.p1  ORF type:complete len:366 (+),score=61.64 TRINITY_DN4299_c0_g1_i1:84-1181(+)
MLDLDKDLEILRVSRDVAAVTASLQTVLDQFNNSQSERMYMSNKMDAYVAALKNHGDDPKVVESSVVVFSHFHNHQNKNLLKEFEVYPLLIDSLKVDTPHKVAIQILDLMCDSIVNYNAEIVKYFRTTKMLEAWSQVLVSLPRGHDLRNPLFDKMRQCLIESEVIEVKATPENVQWMSKLASAINEEHLKTGEFDVYSHYHLQQVHHYLWIAPLVKFKSVHQRLLEFKGDVKYEILEIVGYNLAAKDSNGFSDPFISIKDSSGKRLWKSSVQKKTLNPHWDFKNAPIELTTKLNNEEHHLDVTIWDKDLIGQDYMGQCLLVTCPLLTLQESCPQGSVLIFHELSSASIRGKIKGCLGVRYRITLL